MQKVPIHINDVSEIPFPPKTSDIFLYLFFFLTALSFHSPTNDQNIPLFLSYYNFLNAIFHPVLMNKNRKCDHSTIMITCKQITTQKSERTSKINLQEYFLSRYLSESDSTRPVITTLHYNFLRASSLDITLQ
jgi:hypothetical protein